jgi:hypothetical protein
MDAFLLKLDGSGNKLWMKSWVGTKDDVFYSVAATPDGGFVVGGETISADGAFAGLQDFVDTPSGRVPAHKAILLKFDANGATTYWKRVLMGSRTSAFKAIAVEPSSGDVYASVTTTSDNFDFQGIAGMGREDSVLLRLNKNGGEQWLKPFASISAEEITALTPANGGGVLAVGYISSASYNFGSFKGSFGTGFGQRGRNDAVALKYRPDGSVSWIKTIGDTTDDQATGVVALEGGYAVTGWTTAVTQYPFAYDWLDKGYGGGEQDGFLALLSENGGMVKFQPISGEGKDWAFGIAGRGRNFAVAGSSPSRESFFQGASPQGSGLNHVGYLALYQTQWK